MRYAVKGVSKEHYYNIAHSTCLQYISIARRELTRRKGLPMNLEYSRVGDYLLPNIVLREPPNAPPLGRYGMLRKHYLQQHRPILYNRLLLTEKLFPHLREIDISAQTRLDTIADREQAHEIILTELVYN
jgi:hypothetical protein